MCKSKNTLLTILLLIYTQTAYGNFTDQEYIALMNEKKTCQHILELTDNPTPIQLKKAYRALALKYHPDRNPNNKEKAFAKIRKAYESCNEARAKLQKIAPTTLGAASRISGVSPADLAVIMVYIGR